MKSHDNQKGFTLVEVLVSFLMLAIALTVMLGLNLSSLKVDYKNLRLDDVVRTANQKLDQIRQEDFGDVDDDMDNITSLTTGHSYPYTLVVTDETNWRKKVELTINWTERIRIVANESTGKEQYQNKGKSLTMTTYVVDY